MNRKEILRFAPSPTGDLHVGGARAALFNWLYARKVGGKFCLRIEDTDTERSSERALHSILDSLRWLGLDWDGDLVFQSKRGDIYRAAVEKLLANGAAYRCYCTKEELEEEHEHAVAEKLDYHYSGKCRNLDVETIERNTAGGRPYTVRFRVPEGATAWDDMVHEHTVFQNDTIGDFIIARADGSPVYLLGVAVDDADMGITIVMRGDDHLSNTPKQIMLMQALGAEIPRFAHLPQVLGQDKKKLSKRHGAASVMEYRKMGFLAPALVNFLALLGWSPGDDREKMSLAELIDAFSIEAINKKSGVFDMQKLEWLNGQYMSETPDEDIMRLAEPFFIESGLATEEELSGMQEYLLRVVHLLKERCRVIPDFAEKSGYFFRDPEAYDEKGAAKHFADMEAAVRLEILANRFEKLPVFDEASAEEVVRIYAEELGIGGGKLIHPIRLAATGITAGPGLFDILVAIGRERTVERLREAARHIRERE